MFNKFCTWIIKGYTGADSGGGGPGSTPPKKRERTREGRKYVHQEGTAADPVESDLMSYIFFFFTFFGNHKDL